MGRLRCWMETVYLSVALKKFPFALVSGHDYDNPTTRQEGTRIIETLTCNRCGHTSEGWRDFS